MHVLLINSFSSATSTAGYYQRFLAPMPPITLAYLAAALEQADVRVSVYDDALSFGDPVALEATLRRIRPSVVGLSVVTATMPGAERVVRVIRRVVPEATVVLGNLHASVYHEALLLAGLADVVVHGEGEQTLVALVRELAKAAPDLSRIEGVSFRDGDRVVVTPPRPYLADLDELPFPAWHLFSLERYRLFNFARVREPGLLVQGSRGCPYRCTYCSLKIMGHKRRARSATHLADEFEYLLDRFGIRQPSFTDAIFPFSRAEGVAFASELIRRGLHREQVWITETRTDRVDGELLEALAESGLRRIMYGFETAAAEELEAVHKGVGADVGFRAVRMTRRAGVQIIGFFMIGMPGATRESLQRTIDYACALDIDFAKFTVFVPFPGTESYRQLLASGEIVEPQNWERYTCYPTRSLPPNYVPRGLTAGDLIAAQRRAFFTFYLRPQMVARQLLTLRTLRWQDARDGVGALLGGWADGRGRS